VRPPEANTDWPEWWVANWSALPTPGATSFEVGEGDWPFRGFVLRWQDRLYAYANICPHRSHPLDMPVDEFFAADGKLLRCGSHGALFAPDSGECLLGPCAGRRLLALSCRIDGDDVLVTAPGDLQTAIELVGRT